MDCILFKNREPHTKILGARSREAAMAALLADIVGDLRGASVECDEITLPSGDSWGWEGDGAVGAHIEEDSPPFNGYDYRRVYRWIKKRV